MALDPSYIAAVDLCEYFVDKSTGNPLAGGIVTFWEDAARTIPKIVYTISGSAPNYSYVALPNPINLSNTGTFQDASGNNLPVYYYPYDADGNLQLYYITVTDSLGTNQFTRQAWPPGASISAKTTQGNTSNELTNPQFAEVLFTSPLTISFTTSTNVVIAPGWTLNITATGSGTITVTQNAIAGSSNYPFNPPYTLTIAPGANISGLTLTQTFTGNPAIWAPQPGAADGFVATSILLAPLSSVTINYVPSNGLSTTLLTTNNLTGLYTQFNNTAQLPPSTNADTGATGSVNFTIVLSPTASTTIGNLQVVGLETNTEITYEQTTTNRQIDQSFNYFNPLLQAKPIPSYLIGWDFPLNPAQFLTSTVTAIASGTNSSNYFWDQTIIFQSANSGVAASRGTDGSLVLTAGADTRLALVQYLEAPLCTEMLTNYLSCMMKAHTNNVGGLPVTISLWYTTGTLPTVSAATYKSLVATLNADGSVATNWAGSQAWVQIGRSNLGNASFTLANGTSYSLNGFQGWLDTLGGSATATYFAIVVGTGTLSNTKTLTIQSISCVPGQIPTIPAPKSQPQTLLECCRYYTKSFSLGTAPAQNSGNEDACWFPSTVGNNGQGVCPQIPLPTTMVKATPSYTFYNPQANNAFVWNYNTMASFAATSLQQAGNRSFAINFTADATCQVGHVLGFHFSADARLGT